MADVIWLASYPKSGNTWARALLAGYFGEGAFDLNDMGQGVHIGGLRSLSDLLGVDPALLRRDELDEYRPAAARLIARDVADRDGPAVSKIHSANYHTCGGELVYPPGAGRAVYIARNPLDVATSMAPFFNRTLTDTIATMADPDHTLNDRHYRFTQVLPERMLTWSDHVCSWLDAPGLPVHLVRYEDLKADTASAFEGILRTMGTDPDPERVRLAVEASRFDRLKAREASEGFREHPRMSATPFFRKGKTGAWRDELSHDQARRVVADHREVMMRLGYGDSVAEVEALP